MIITLKVFTIAIYVILIALSARRSEQVFPIQIGSRYRFMLASRFGDNPGQLAENDLLECEVLELVLNDPDEGNLYEVRSCTGNEFCAWGYELRCI